MRDILKRGCFSFAISSFCGLIVNLLIDGIANWKGSQDFVSISPDFVALFPTPVMAAYVNILLYGVIGAVFAMMTFIYDCDRIGFIIQNILYFAVTSLVCVGITILLWQLQHYIWALVFTLSGYAATHIIMGVIIYRRLRRDIRVINEEIPG